MKKILYILLFPLLLFSCSTTNETIKEISIIEKIYEEPQLIGGKNIENSITETISEGGKDDGNRTIFDDLGIPIEEPINQSQEEIVEYIEIPPIEPMSNNLDYINKGDIIYIIKDSMVVGEISIVDMTISKNMDITEIITEIETFSDESIYTENIRIAPIMRAKLIDPTGTNFTIIPITPEEQIIENNGYTTWKWNVIPLIKGSNDLYLSVDVIIDNNSKSIEVYNDKILVISNETITMKITNFFLEYWEWFLSTLIIPILSFFYKSKIKKKLK